MPDLYTNYAKDIFNKKIRWIKLDDPDNQKWVDDEHLKLQYKIILPIEECYPTSQSINVYMDIIHKHLEAMHKELDDEHISFTFDEVVNPKPVQILGGDRFMHGDKLWSYRSLSKRSNTSIIIIVGGIYLMTKSKIDHYYRY